MKRKVLASMLMVPVSIAGVMVLSQSPAGANPVPAMESPHLESWGDLIPDGTDTFQAFYCQQGNILLSGNAFRQIGAGPVTPLEAVNYEADTYPDGIIFKMVNDSGHDEYYQVHLICSHSIDQ